MKAWLIYDRAGADRNRDYIDYHQEVGARYGIKFQLRYAEDIPEYEPERLPEETRPDFAIVRTIMPAVNALLEAHGIPTYNNSRVSYLTNHKGRCIEYVSKKTDVPVIPTTVLSYGAAVISTDKQGYVLKPAGGHGGNGVRRIPAGGLPEETMKNLLQEDDYILQPFIEGPREDVRVYVIGDRIVAAVRRRATGEEFRANASLGGCVERFELNETERDYVRQIISVFDFGMVGIDFIIDDGGAFLFNEIEDVVGARMLYRACPEIDILDEYIRFIRDRVPPAGPGTGGSESLTQP